MTDKLPYIQLYVRDFLSSSKVSLMSAEAVGAYVFLMCNAWLQDPAGSLPDDDSVLARLARVSLSRWKAIKAEVLSAWELKEGRWEQDRLVKEYEKANKTWSKKSAGGRASAESKKAGKPQQEAQHSVKSLTKSLDPMLKDTCKTLSTIPEAEAEAESKAEPIPPTPLPEPKPPPAPRRSDRENPSTRFNAARQSATTIAEILAAYPVPSGGNAAHNAIADALNRVRHGSDQAWPEGVPRPPDPAAWLLGRVRAYAASAEAKRDGGQWVPSPKVWFGEGRYCESDEVWNRSRDGTPAISPIDAWLQSKGEVVT